MESQSKDSAWLSHLSKVEIRSPAHVGMGEALCKAAASGAASSVQGRLEETLSQSQNLQLPLGFLQLYLHLVYFLVSVPTFTKQGD
jgi:hypothetical protein